MRSSRDYDELTVLATMQSDGNCNCKYGVLGWRGAHVLLEVPDRCMFSVTRRQKPKPRTFRRAHAC